MVHKIVNKAIEITDDVLAWGCLLTGTVLVGIAFLGIILPLMLALPLLALAAAYFEKKSNVRSLVPAPA